LFAFSVLQNKSFFHNQVLKNLKYNFKMVPTEFKRLMKEDSIKRAGSRVFFAEMRCCDEYVINEEVRKQCLWALNDDERWGSSLRYDLFILGEQLQIGSLAP
jgi:hypothetical protein